MFFCHIKPTPFNISYKEVLKDKIVCGLVYGERSNVIIWLTTLIIIKWILCLTQFYKISLYQDTFHAETFQLVDFKCNSTL